ncbi:MAG: DUF6570 domain-containing protein [Myxococcota bacterium]
MVGSVMAAVGGVAQSAVGGLPVRAARTSGWQQFVGDVKRFCQLTVDEQAEQFDDFFEYLEFEATAKRTLESIERDAALVDLGTAACRDQERARRRIYLSCVLSGVSFESIMLAPSAVSAKWGGRAVVDPRRLPEEPQWVVDLKWSSVGISKNLEWSTFAGEIAQLESRTEIDRAAFVKKRARLLGLAGDVAYTDEEFLKDVALARGDVEAESSTECQERERCLALRRIWMFSRFSETSVGEVARASSARDFLRMIGGIRDPRTLVEDKAYVGAYRGTIPTCTCAVCGVEDGSATMVDFGCLPEWSSGLLGGAWERMMTVYARLLEVEGIDALPEGLRLGSLRQNGLLKGTSWCCRSCCACLRRREVPELALVNYRWFGDVPEELSELSRVEMSCISLLNPIMSIYVAGTPAAGAATNVACRGSLFTCVNTVAQITNTLPKRLRKDEFMVMQNPRARARDRRLLFRPAVVLRALKWLVENNFFYKEYAKEHPGAFDFTAYGAMATEDGVPAEGIPDDDVGAVSEAIHVSAVAAAGLVASMPADDERESMLVVESEVPSGGDGGGADGNMSDSREEGDGLGLGVRRRHSGSRRIVGQYELPADDDDVAPGVRPHEVEFFYEKAMPWLTPFGVGGPGRLGDASADSMSSDTHFAFARHALHLGLDRRWQKSALFSFYGLRALVASNGWWGGIARREKLPRRGVRTERQRSRCGA